MFFLSRRKILKLFFSQFKIFTTMPFFSELQRKYWNQAFLVYVAHEQYVEKHRNCNVMLIFLMILLKSTNFLYLKQKTLKKKTKKKYVYILKIWLIL